MALLNIELNLTTVGQKFIQFVLFQVIYIYIYIYICIYVYIYIFCSPFYKKLTCDHEGIKDMADHCNNESHKKCVEASKKQGNLNSFLKPSYSATQLDQHVIKIMMTNFLV